MEPKWLQWAKQILSTSQAGLTYTKDVFDKERYEQLRNLSLEIMSFYTEMEIEKIKSLFANEIGYQTPKVVVRGVTFKDNKILLVKEVTDQAWALPGGWADIGVSPKQNMIKEYKEETGFDVLPIKLIGLYDKSLHNQPTSLFHEYTLFMLCEIVGGAPRVSLETTEVGFFEENNLPPLSVKRTTEEQLIAFFRYLKNPTELVFFD